MRRWFHPLLPFLLSVFLFISFGGQGAEASSPLKRSDGGKKWAFCIGIGDYEDPGISDLTRPSNDAEGLARALKEHGGFDHVVLLTDDRDKSDPLYPSNENIRKTLKDYETRIKGPDMVLFSFFGQGYTASSGRAFLLAADTQSKRIDRTALPLDAVLGFIKKTGVKRSLVFLDASREKVLKRGERESMGIYPDRYLRKGLTAIFYAARNGQYAYDHDGSIHGVFGEYLISGLRGDADKGYGGNGDGFVSLMELAAHVREGMTGWSMARTEKQMPYIKILGRGMERMVLSSSEKIDIPEVAVSVKPAPKAAIPVKPVPMAAKQMDQKIKSPELAKRAEVKPSPEKEKQEIKATPERKEMIIGAPAPKIVDLTAEKETPKTPEEEKRETPKIPKEIKAEKPAPSEAPPLKAEERSPEETIEKKAMLPAPEEETSAREKLQEPGARTSVAVAERPEGVDVEPRPLFLRNRARDLSTEDLGLMLHRYRFYATCWNYNGDFCNPDGVFQNRFIDNKNKTVSDRATSLMWMKGGSPDAVTWADARAYVAQLNRVGFAEYKDWRLPTIEELASLMENSWLNNDLFIDPVFDKTQRYCWSIDTRGVNKAWKANFHLGFFIDFPMSSLNSVRPVRSFFSK